MSENFTKLSSNCFQNSNVNSNVLGNIQNNTDLTKVYEEIYVKRFGSRALLSKLGTVLLHFSRRSTVHGLNHFAQARSAKHRLFWLTISCCAALGFCINLFYLIEKFLQTPVLTNVFHDYNNFTYPDLSICIVNPIYFPPKFTKQYQDLVDVIREFDKITNNSRFQETNIGLTSYSQKIELSDYLFMHSKLEYSHQPWTAIILCRYLKKPCNYTHFETRHIWPYGNCFTFNGTKMGVSGTRDVKKNTFLNGWRPDFKLVIYKALEYPKSLQLDPFNDINKPSGVMVMIHEPNTYPHIGESFVVDSFTQVDLKITTKSHLSTVKKCKSTRSNYTYYDFKTNTSTTFVGRQGDCLFSLIQTNVAKYCGCQLHKMPVLKKHQNLPFCFDVSFKSFEINNKEINEASDSIGRKDGRGNDTSKHMNLTECLHKSLDDVDREQVRHLCYSDLCEHPSFSTVVSHSKYPAVGERQTHLLWLENLSILESREIENFGRSELFKLSIYRNNKTNPHNFKSIAEVLEAGRTDLLKENFVNKNFMHLRFVPSSLFMDHVEETEEYPLSRLLSDIGGCVGLWVGASLITVFEFIDLLLDLSEIVRQRAQAAAAFKRCYSRSQNQINSPNLFFNELQQRNSIFAQYTCRNLNNKSPPLKNNDNKIYYNTNTYRHSSEISTNNLHETSSLKSANSINSKTISHNKDYNGLNTENTNNNINIVNNSSNNSSLSSEYDQNSIIAQTDIIMSV